MAHPAKRINVLTAAEQEDFYGVSVFDHAQQAHYFALNKQDEIFVNQQRKIEDKVYCLLSLGYFRAKHSLIEFTHNEVRHDRQFIMKNHFPDKNIPKRLPSKYKRTRIQNKILKHTQYKRCIGKTADSIKTTLKNLVKKHPKAKALTKSLLEHMANTRIALPSYRILQDLITKSLSHEERRLTNIISRYAAKDDFQRLDRLLTEDSEIYNITAIKQDAKDFSFTETTKEINKAELMTPIYRFIGHFLPKLGLPAESIKYYGSLVTFYNVYKLNRMRSKQKYLYLICYIHSKQQKINDNIVQFFHYYVKQFHDEADEEGKKLITQQKLAASDLYTKASDVLELFINTALSDKIEFGAVRHMAFKILSREEFPIVQKFFTDDKFDEKRYYWARVDAMSGRVRKNLRPIFSIIAPLVEGNGKITMAVKIFKEIIAGHYDEKMPLSKQLLSMVPQKMLPYIEMRYEKDSSIKLVNIKRLEFYLYYKIHYEINCYRAFVKNTLNYKSMKDELIPKEIWGKDQRKILKNTGFTRLLEPVDRILLAHQKQLDPLIISVNKRIQSGENKQIKVSPITNKWTLPYQPKEDTTNHPFFLRLPQLSIVDVLYFVDKKCNFTKYFAPIQRRYVKKPRDNKLIFAAVLANAIRAGTYKMASISDITFTELSTAEKTYIRLETLRDTIDCINNATAKLPIFKHWNISNTLHSALDGSKIGTRLHNIKARYSSKYFGMEKGVSSYNMVTNHLPINARLIGANEHESHFLFDVIRGNTSIILPNRHSGDGHSLNQVNFALLDFIANKFMPCFPQINKKKIYCFGDLSNFDDCIIKPSRKIRANLIASEWHDVLHIAASLLQGTTSQSVIVRKLSSANYRNKVKDALWEYDKILQSIYILNYIDDPKIQQSVRTAINRTEGYHQLCRAVAFIDGGRFRGKSELELEVWNDCARLVSCAIIFYNAYILSSLLERKEVMNDEQHFNLITQLSPVAWQHVNLLGKYEFDRPRNFVNIEAVIDAIRMGNE